MQLLKLLVGLFMPFCLADCEAYSISYPKSSFISPAVDIEINVKALRKFPIEPEAVSHLALIAAYT